MRVVGVGILVVVALLMVWGVAVELRLLLDRQEVEAEIPGLPDGWAGRRVALVADFQTGMWLDNPGMVRRALAEAVDGGAALILIAGDLMYRPDSTRAREAAALVRPAVASGVPVVAVLGNHDYSLMKKHNAERTHIAEYLTARLREAGVTVLENEAVAVALPEGGDSLWVVGVGSVWAENSRRASAVAGVPAGAPRLALMHNPESHGGFPAGTAPVALAAHTHGGQVRLPGLPRWSWLDIVRRGEVAGDGWIARPEGAGRLYVNRGIGFSTVPLRINCRPELTLVTLRPAS